MYNAVVRIIHRDDKKMVFRVYPDSIRLRYTAGQYGALGLSRGAKRIDGQTNGSVQDESLVKRAYSISSSILDDRNNILDLNTLEYYEFYVNLVLSDEATLPRLSPRLFSLKDDDRIFIGEKIIGHHTPSYRKRGKNLLLISTTTGEAPHNSLITEALQQKENCHMCNIVVNEGEWTSAYTKKHEALMNMFPQYRYRALQNDRGYQNIGEILEHCFRDGDFSKKELGWAATARDTHIYLCGDPLMIGAPKKLGAWQYEYPDYGLVRLFTKHQFNPVTRFQPGNISYESYW